MFSAYETTLHHSTRSMLRWYFKLFVSVQQLLPEILFCHCHRIHETALADGAAAATGATCLELFLRVYAPESIAVTLHIWCPQRGRPQTNELRVHNHNCLKLICKRCSYETSKWIVCDQHLTFRSLFLAYHQMRPKTRNWSNSLFIEIPVDYRDSGRRNKNGMARVPLATITKKFYKCCHQTTNGKKAHETEI